MQVLLQSLNTGVTNPTRFDIYINPNRVRRLIPYTARQVALDLTSVVFDATDSVVVVGTVAEVNAAITTQMETYENDRDIQRAEADDAWRAASNEEQRPAEETDGTVLGVSGDGEDDASVYSAGPEASNQFRP